MNSVQRASALRLIKKLVRMPLPKGFGLSVTDTIDLLRELVGPTLQPRVLAPDRRTQTRISDRRREQRKLVTTEEERILDITTANI